MSATQQKRGRACEACSRIKIRCELGSAVDATPPCERCVRLGKDCALVAPKRQKDRVAELEAEVERLTRLLREKGVVNAGDDSVQQQPVLVTDDPSTRTTGNVSAGLVSKKKKRKLDNPEDAVPPNMPESVSQQDSSITAKPTQFSTQNAAVAILDRIVSKPMQERLLNRYVNQLLPHFPLVLPPDNYSLDSLRNDHPLLLHAIVYAACPGVLPLESQEEITIQLLRSLANGAITEGKKSLELIQALHITCLWFRSPAQQRHVAVYQLVQLAVGIALDLGLGGPESCPTPLPGLTTEHQELECAHAWRAWLTCYLLSSSMAMFSRCPNAVSWTPWHDYNMIMLDCSGSSVPSDRWLTQYIRGEQLCEQIAELLGFYDVSTSTDIAGVSMKRRRQNCRNQIAAWRSQIPAALQVPTLLFWEYVAIAYLNEAVLHTATNKRSFAAPYVPERLSVTDFPTPNVTPDHTASLLELRCAAHSIIDIFVAWDTGTLVTLPALVFASRTAYALYMLTKIYVAVTAPGNTYGAVFDANELQLEQRIDQLLQKSAAITAIDTRCGTARILRSAHRAKDWYTSYTATLEASPATTSLDQSPEYGAVNLYAPYEPAVGAALSAQESVNLEELFMSSDGAADYGMESLFTEPPVIDPDFPSYDPSKALPSDTGFITPSAFLWMK